MTLTTEENFTFRPKRFRDYVGQPEVIEKLRIAVGSARQRNAQLEHVLLAGPPGLGKTTVAMMIATEMKSPIKMIVGSALTKVDDLVGIVCKLNPGETLFIDEVHRIQAGIAEYLYTAMEDFRIDLTIGVGKSARIVSIKLAPFTLIGATTRIGMLPDPFRARFGIQERLDLYSVKDLRTILETNAPKLGITCSNAVCSLVAFRSRGTPRVANRLLRRVRDYSLVAENSSRIGLEVAKRALELQGIDRNGLDEGDRKYIRVLRDTYAGGPVGVAALAMTMDEEQDTLEDVIEPYLLTQGLLARTLRGRMLTDAGKKYKMN